MHHTGTPSAAQIEDLYHECRGAVYAGATTRLLEELMAAARARPNADELIVVVGLSGVGWVQRVDYWTRPKWEDKDGTPRWADFALVIEGAHFASYIDLWEQIEQQLLRMVDETHETTTQ